MSSNHAKNAQSGQFDICMAFGWVFDPFNWSVLRRAASQADRAQEVLDLMDKLVSNDIGSIRGMAERIGECSKAAQRTLVRIGKFSKKH